ncbi:MAG: hypothetical protein HY423_03145 [Candidatus Lambdaproteobacteria bacterium]|nr:hypothetical protein [Candidatus Lambdaproteobacteria bacterium]
MEMQHLDLKLPLAQPADLPLEALIPVFHRWVREQVAEELLIDVADYRHLAGGPGLLVIGHEANYGLDLTGGRPGLRYTRKVALPGGLAAQLATGLRALGQARERLEQEPTLPEPLRFNRGELELRINDRLLAPNTPETFRALEPELRGFFRENLGVAGLELEHHADPRELFHVTLRAQVPLDAVLTIPQGWAPSPSAQAAT